MKSLALVLALVSAGCADSSDDFPIVTQGGTPPTGGGGTTASVAGRVCVVTDPRFLTTCVDTGVDNLTVTMTTPTTSGPITTTTVTGPNGSFVVNTPVTTAVTGPTTFTVTGPNIVP